MNLQDTVALMFPLGVVAQSIPDNSSFFEVNEIPARSVPQNCAMLATGEFQYSRDQDCTGSFLVQAEEHVFFHTHIFHPFRRLACRGGGTFGF
ncbi:hypothetical protein MIZ03_2189 [Rhodoferax lithotrophicus]|uniref:Uncharacterized protein n=1 Tax=Rhodoferax lithotrophicus TaxID=2798804 RepID=A0ABM7MLT3_9BURK|nr:hypothetical protein [Rhodoferax sp. MIZ03]BCO27301.1 hypothetical protein MIZ03_2189 [Rhodoferax sp. MIZ03]